MLTSVTGGSSAWELMQEHWDELKAPKALCGSRAETRVELAVDPRSLTLYLAFL